MSAVDSITFFFDELNDMVSVFRLYYSADFFSIDEVEGDICEFWYELSFSDESEFSASFSAFCVFGIESGEHSEVCLSGHDSFGEVSEFGFDSVGFFFRNGWVEG